MKGNKKPNETLIRRMRLLAESNGCIGLVLPEETEEDFCIGCFDITTGRCKNERPDYWDCNNEAESAKEWLAQNGIKE